MYLRHSLITVVLLALQLALARVIDEANGKGSGETERIVGGSDAEAGQFPYAVALYYETQFICTASIISPTTVLTAAHCVFIDGNLQPSYLFYATANVNRNAKNVSINFREITPHPNYQDNSADYDIAVLRTTEPIPFSDEVGSVCIARSNTSRIEYWNATAMGWGSTGRIQFLPVYPENLQYAEQKIVVNTVCSAFFGGIAAVNGDKMCATGFFTGICSGDSGGPLVHLSADKQPVEIGIASYINRFAGCGNLAPGVFTRVSSYANFINDTTQDTGICWV